MIKLKNGLAPAVACWIDFNDYLAHLVAVDLAVVWALS
jgi:Ser/Thr protein kinase RdoA (MazF antagonist)